MDLHGLVKRLDVPSGVVVPSELAFGDLRAHVLTRADLHDDVAGINDSLDVIRQTRGGTWPAEAVTEEFDYVDLVWHECEFRNHDSFSYVLRDLDGAYLGCCYPYPMGRRTPLTDALLVHDVDVSWWITKRSPSSCPGSPASDPRGHARVRDGADGRSGVPRGRRAERPSEREGDHDGDARSSFEPSPAQAPPPRRPRVPGRTAAHLR